MVYFALFLYFQSVCLLRRAILLCVENDVLSVGVIAKRLSVEVNIAKGLLNKLLDEGALKDVRGRRYVCLMAAFLALLFYFTKCLCVGPVEVGIRLFLRHMLRLCSYLASSRLHLYHLNCR